MLTNSRKYGIVELKEVEVMREFINLIALILITVFGYDWIYDWDFDKFKDEWFLFVFSVAVAWGLWLTLIDFMFPPRRRR